MDHLGNISQLDIDYCFILTDDVGGLVSVVDGKGIFQWLSRDSVSLYKGLVDAVDLGS